MTDRTIFLRGDIVDLVVLTTADVETTKAWMNDHSVTQFLSRGDTPATTDSQTQWTEGLAKRDNDLTLGIWHRADQKLIGSTGLHQISQRDQHADFGIVIGDKDYWSGGCGTDTLQTLLQYAFEIRNLRQVKLEVLGNNPRAKRCYEKCGFKLIGTMPNRIFKQGQWHDVDIMIAGRPE